MRAGFLLIGMMALRVVSLTAQETDFPALIGPYLGQSPPGAVPEIFAPEIISRESDFEHSAAVFSPDGKEVFWCMRRNLFSDLPGDEQQRLYFMKNVDGKWTAPQMAPFMEEVPQSVFRPVFSPDGNRIYLEYFSDPDAERDTDIYVVEREGDGWSRPAPVSPLINTPAMETLFSVTRDGSMYFGRHVHTRNEKVFVSRMVDGVFSEPEELGDAFNTPAREGMILVAPDESFMLVSQTPLGMADERVMVSYQRPDGTWTERIETPLTFTGGFLSLSPDGNYLFFLGEGILWVGTSFIEELKPGYLKNVGSVVSTLGGG
ncbi:MAG: hypothetical protein PVJ76_19460 [Gemmatimonadota bacterium]